jgi:Peptidase A4 family
VPGLSSRIAISAGLLGMTASSVAFSSAPRSDWLGWSCQPLRVFAPASGFRPLHAAPAALIANGFPPRPPASDQAGLRSWQDAVGRAVRFVPPDPVCGTTGRGTVGSDNWAGHVVPKARYGRARFTAVQAEWVQPAVAGQRGYRRLDSAPTASFWTGIGVTNLIQAGADSVATSRPVYRFWTEDYPQNMVWEGPPIRPGQTVFVYICYLGHHRAYFYLENVTTGQVSAFTNQAPYVGADAVNFINERPNGRSLPRFGVVSVRSARFWQGSRSYRLTAVNDRWDMTRNCRSDGLPLSKPTAVSGGSFTQVWYRSRPYVNTC